MFPRESGPDKENADFSDRIDPVHPEGRGFDRDATGLGITMPAGPHLPERTT